MPSQSCRPYLPRVQDLVCLGLVHNILYLKKKFLPPNNMNSSVKGIQSQLFSIFRKTPNLGLHYWSGQQELCLAGAFMENTYEENVSYRALTE